MSKAASAAFFMPPMIYKDMLLSDDEIYDEVRAAMYDVLAVLYEHGITVVHVGAMMRLLGVRDEVAAQHDDERVELDETFGELVEVENNNNDDIEVPPGTTFH
jgi:hypothetical protein